MDYFASFNQTRHHFSPFRYRPPRPSPLAREKALQIPDMGLNSAVSFFRNMHFTAFFRDKRSPK